MATLRRASLAFFLLAGTAGCGGTDAPAKPLPSEVTLLIGFGLTTGQNPESGIRQAAGNIAWEGLVGFDRSGRPQPWLAERVVTSQDGRTLRIDLRKGVTFHNGVPVMADAIRKILAERLPQELGPAFQDIEDIRTSSAYSVEFSLKEPSAFLVESLGFPIQGAGDEIVGTGPFQVTAEQNNQVEMRAYDAYYGESPAIDRIVFKPYASRRAAWADMLRGEVDMLYDVGIEALDSLQMSTDVQVVSHVRPYTYVLQFNLLRPRLRDAKIRRALNAAIDRSALVKDVLKGHGIEATGPVWPNHWAYDRSLPGFKFQPDAIADPVELTCIFADVSLERFALAVQRQLQAVGVELSLELLSVDQALARVDVGDFDLFFADASHGPSLVRPYLFWHTGGRYNWGKFSSNAVDAALDSIRHAADDGAYEAGVAAFQRAIVDDPPAIFLAWSERARAVSTRFEVPVEPGRDILSTLRLWRPVPADN